MGGNAEIDWDFIWTRGVDYSPPFHQNHFLVLEVQDMVARMTKVEQLFFLNFWWPAQQWSAGPPSGSHCGCLYIPTTTIYNSEQPVQCVGRSHWRIWTMGRQQHEKSGSDANNIVQVEAHTVISENGVGWRKGQGREWGK